MADVLKPGIHQRFTYAPHHQEEVRGVTHRGNQGRSVFISFDEAELAIWVLPPPHAVPNGAAAESLVN